MMEIKIENNDKTWLCNFPDSSMSNEIQARCKKPACQWRLDGEVIMIACKEHGEILLNAINRTKLDRRNSIAITGGYDEPESKLAEIRELLQECGYSAGIKDIHLRLIDYLEEKEGEA
jgi:hypothetical protein